MGSPAGVWLFLLFSHRLISERHLVLREILVRRLFDDLKNSEISRRSWLLSARIR
jgi:hypothetical protein